MSSTKLHELPEEIIRKIFVLCPCESALNLQKVCRLFHQICCDWGFYRDVINDFEWTDDAVWRRWQPATLSSKDPVEMWARYALAASTVSGLTDAQAKEGYSSPTCPEFVNWSRDSAKLKEFGRIGPQLAVQRRKASL